MFNIKDELSNIKIPTIDEALTQADAERILFPDKFKINGEFLRLSYYYKHLFGKYLILQTGLDKVDKHLELKGFIPQSENTMEFHQKYDSMGLSHLYIRVLARVDRLTKDETEHFKSIIDSDSQSAWLDSFNFIRDTFRKIMTVSPDNPQTFFEPSMTLFRTYMIKGDSVPLVLKATYERKEYDDKRNEEKETLIAKLAGNLDYALTKDLGCPIKTSFLLQ